MTVGSAASRLLEKDSRIRAANIRIKSLEKDLILSRSHAEDVEDAYADHRQLKENYIIVQKDTKEMRDRNILLEQQYKELASNLQDKEKALDIAQNLLKTLDKKRLQELEQLGIALIALKNDHKNNLDKSINEINNLKKELESNQAIYDDNIISLDKKSMELQVQYEEQLAKLEGDFEAFKQTNLSKGVQSVNGMQLDDVEYKEQNKEQEQEQEQKGEGGLRHTSSHTDSTILGSTEAKEFDTSLESALTAQRIDFEAAQNTLLTDLRTKEEASISQLGREYSSSLTAVCKELSDLKAEHEKARDLERTSLTRMKEDMKNKDTYVSDLEAHVRAREEEHVHTMQAALAAAHTQHAKQTQDLELSFTHRLSVEVKAVISMQQLIADGHIAREVLEERTAALQGHCQQQKLALDTLYSKKSALESQLSELVMTITVDQHNTHDLTMTNTALQQRVSALQDMVDSEKNKAQAMVTAQAVAEEREGQSMKAMATAEERIKELESTVHQDKERVVAMAVDRGILNNQVTELQRLLSDGQVSSSELTAAKATADNRVADLEKLCAASHVRIEELIASKLSAEKLAHRLDSQAVVDNAHINELVETRTAHRIRVAELEKAVKMREENILLITNSEIALADRLSSTDSEFKKLQISHNNLEKKKVELEELSEHLKAQLEGADHNNRQLQQSTTELNVLLSERDSLISQHIMRIEVLTADDSVRVDRVLELEKELSGVRAQIMDLSQEKASLKCHVSELENRIGQELDRTAKVVDTEEALNSQIVGLKATTDEYKMLVYAAAKTEADLKNSIDDLQGLLSDGQVSSSELMAAKVTADNRVADLEKLCAASHVRIGELIAAEASLVTSLTGAQSQTLDDRDVIDKLASSNAAFKGLITELQSKLEIDAVSAADEAAARSDLAFHVMQLESQLSEQTTRVVSVTAEKDLTDVGLADLQAQLVEGKSRIQELQNNLSIVRSAATDLAVEALEKDNQLQVFAETVETLNALVLELNIKVEHHEECIAASETAKSIELTRVSALERDYREVEERLTDAVRTVAEHLVTISTIERHSLDSQATQDALRATAVTLETQLSELVTTITVDQHNTHDLTMTNTALQQRVSALQDKVESEQSKAQAMVTAKAAIEMQIQVLAAEHSTAEATALACLEATQSELSRVVRELDELRGEQDISATRCIYLESQTMKDKCALDELLTTKDTLAELVCELESEERKDKNRIDDLSKENSGLHNRIVELEDLIEEEGIRMDEFLESQSQEQKNVLEAHVKEQKNFYESESLNQKNLHMKQIDELKTNYEYHIKAIEEEDRKRMNTADTVLAENARLHIISLTKQHNGQLEAALHALKTKLSDQHNSQLSHALEKSKRDFDTMQQILIADIKSSAEALSLSSSKQLVETLGQESRDALESQRKVLEREREADREKAKEVVRVLVAEHEAAVCALDAVNALNLERALSDRENVLCAVHKAALLTAQQSARIEAERSILEYSKESDATLTEMRAQHVSAIEKVRSEMACLRNEALGSEIKHHKMLSASQESHLQELCALRTALEANHSKEMQVLRGQIQHAKGRYDDVISADADRHDTELQVLRLQRESLDTVLQFSVREQEAQYTRSLKVITKGFEEEKQQLIDKAVQDRVAHDAEIAQIKMQHWVDKDTVESFWKVKIAKELAVVKEGHAEALSAAMIGSAHHDVMLSHSKAVSISICDHQSHKGILAESVLQRQDVVAALEKLQLQYNTATTQHKIESKIEIDSVHVKYLAAVEQINELTQERDKVAIQEYKLLNDAVKVEEDNAACLESLTKSHNRQISDLEQSHKDNITALTVKIEDIKAQLANERIQHTHLASHSLESEKKIAQERSLDKERYQASIEDLRCQHDDALEKLHTKFLLRNEQQKVLFEHQKIQLAAGKAMEKSTLSASQFEQICDLQRAHDLEIESLTSQLEKERVESDKILITNRMYVEQLNDRHVALLSAQSHIDKLAATATSAIDSYEEAKHCIKLMRENSEKQLRSHTANLTVDSATITAAHTHALEALRVTMNDRLLSAGKAHTEDMLRLKEHHKQELLGFNVTYRCDDSSSVHTNKALQHPSSYDGKKEYNVEALRNSNAVKNVLGEGSNCSLDSINAYQIAESFDVTRQVMAQCSSGAVSDLVKLKSKLEAVGVEFAQGEGRGFKHQGSRLRVKEGIALQRQQLDGRIEDESLCLRKSGDVAGRIEYEIERLRSECLKATAR